MRFRPAVRAGAAGPLLLTATLLLLGSGAQTPPPPLPKLPAAVARPGTPLNLPLSTAQSQFLPLSQSQQPPSVPTASSEAPDPFLIFHHPNSRRPVSGPRSFYSALPSETSQLWNSQTVSLEPTGTFLHHYSFSNLHQFSHTHTKFSNQPSSNQPTSIRFPFFPPGEGQPAQPEAPSGAQQSHQPNRLHLPLFLDVPSLSPQAESPSHIQHPSISGPAPPRALALGPRPESELSPEPDPTRNKRFAWVAWAARGAMSLLRVAWRPAAKAIQRTATAAGSESIPLLQVGRGGTAVAAKAGGTAAGGAGASNAGAALAVGLAALGAEEALRNSVKRLRTEDQGGSDPEGSDCTLAVARLPERGPLLLLPTAALSRGPSAFAQPDRRGNLRFARGAQLRLACPGSRLLSPAPRQPDLLAACETATTFSALGVTFDVQDLECEKAPKYEARDTERGCPLVSGRGGRLLTAGYELEGQRWLPLYNSCFDGQRLSTLYTDSVVVRSAEARQRRPGNCRVPFSDGGFYGDVDVDRRYLLDQQVATFTAILGAPLPGRYNLQKGHLAANADFLYITQQCASFFYFNAAPQKGALNQGPWRSLEAAVRRIAAHLDRDLRVVTGTMGQSSGPDSNGGYKPLFLSWDPPQSPRLPVPAFFWKVAQDPVSGNATAFVAYNLPQTGLSPPSSPCTDVCGPAVWARDGVYCCEFRDFNASIPFLWGILPPGLGPGHVPLLRMQG